MFTSPNAGKSSNSSSPLSMLGTNMSSLDSTARSPTSNVNIAPYLSKFNNLDTDSSAPAQEILVAFRNLQSELSVLQQENVNLRQQMDDLKRSTQHYEQHLIPKYEQHMRLSIANEDKLKERLRQATMGRNDAAAELSAVEARARTAESESMQMRLSKEALEVQKRDAEAKLKDLEFNLKSSNSTAALNMAKLNEWEAKHQEFVKTSTRVLEEREETIVKLSADVINLDTSYKDQLSMLKQAHKQGVLEAVTHEQLVAKKKHQSTQEYVYHLLHVIAVQQHQLAIKKAAQKELKIQAAQEKDAAVREAIREGKKKQGCLADLKSFDSCCHRAGQKGGCSCHTSSSHPQSARSSASGGPRRSGAALNAVMPDYFMDNGKANGTDEHKAPSFSARDDDSSRTNRRSRAKDFEGIEDSSELEKMWDQLDAKVLRGVSKVQDDDWKNEESKLVTLRMEKLTKDITKLNELYWQNCSDFVALHGGDRIKLLNNNLAMAKECRKNKVLSKLIQELNDKHQQMWALKQRKAELAEIDDI